MGNKVGHVVLISITIGITILSIFVLGYIVRPTDTDSTYVRIKSFHQLPENSVDVIVYGSSHAFLGVNTLHMNKKYGIQAYNYGTNWQKINTTKLFIQDSLLTQKPKLAIIETFFAGRVLEDTNMTGEIYFTRYLNEKRARRQFLKKCFGNNAGRWLSFYVPLCAFHENWNTLTKYSFMNLDDENYLPVSEVAENLGFAPYDTVQEISIPNYDDMEQLELDEQSLLELNEIVDLCNAKGIHVLFITVPHGLSYGYNQAMKRYAAEKGCGYVDFLQHLSEIGFNEKTDFKDEGHLNTSGATKVADFLGSYVMQNYSLSEIE